MNTFTLIIKPTSECNLRCQYCYHETTHYETGIMGTDLLENIISKAQRMYSEVKYIWHGGEPLLCGIDFFKKIVELQEKYKKDESKIVNIIQTNGTLITSEFCDFFNEHDFFIGISFDGISTNMARQGTEKVLKAFELLNKKKVRYATISVIHNKNLDKQIEMYEYFKANGLASKFNPLSVAGAVYMNKDLVLDEDKYIDSLIEFIKYWMHDQNAVMNTTANQYVRLALGLPVKECLFTSCLYHWVSINHKGELYPCGRDYDEKYCMGNIEDYENIAEAFNSDAYKKLAIESIIRRQKCQENCSIYPVCNGGCNNDAMHENGVTEIDGFMCKVRKKIIPLIQNELKELEENPVFRERLNIFIKEMLGEKVNV